MFIPRFRLGRRAVLRGGAAAGLGAAIPLPRLAGMLNGSGTAYADGTPLPGRFVLWFFGNGTHPGAWVPAKTGVGDAWQLSSQLQPLGAVKDYLSVITGHSMWFPPDATLSVHRYGTSNALTGATFDDVAYTARLPSIDQVVARAPGSAGTPFRSVEMGLCLPDTLRPDPIMSVISHSGPNLKNAPEFNPRTIFTRLFGGSVEPISPADDTDAARAKAVTARKSALDLVAEDSRRLKMRLGAEDRARLDAHLDGIGLLEKQIDVLAKEAGKNICPTAGAVADYPDGTAGFIGTLDVGGNIVQTGDAPPKLDDVMARLIAFALACDRTRVVSYMFTCPSSGVTYRSIGQTEAQHTLCHDEPSPQPNVHRGVVYAMERLAAFLQRMKDTPDGAGNLLDSSCVYVTSDLGNGQSHSTGEVPTLIAGKAGGALRGNVHHRSPDPSVNVNKVLFTISNVMGVPCTSYGLDGARVTDGIGAILA